jgi:antitoxin component of MazEF toxin-antitoxin module
MGTTTKTRRLIKSANSLIITLPADYIRKAGLKKGDVVGVAYDSLMVIVNPNPPKGEVKSNVDNQ